MEDPRTHTTVVLPMKRDYPDRPIVGVGAVVVREGRALVVRRATEPLKGEWSIPGGVLELGEKLREGVAREVLEETGLEVEAGEVLEVFDSIIADPDGKTQYHYVLIDFLCRVKEGQLKAGSDVSEARWVSVAELSSLGLRDATVAVIRRGLERCVSSSKP
jgi:8-oxo-dGTP diphosphatase